MMQACKKSRALVIFGLSLLLIAESSAASWSPDPPVTIPNSTAATLGVYSSCDPTTGVYLTTWHTASNVCYGLLYNPPSWTLTPINLSTPAVPLGLIASSCDTSRGNFLLTWNDNNNGISAPYFLLVDNTGSPVGVTTPAIIPNLSGIGCTSNVFSSCNPATGEFFITWRDNNNCYYARYDSFNGTWPDAPQQIPTFAQGTSDVFSSFNPTTGDFCVTWQNLAYEASFAIYRQYTGWVTQAGQLSTFPLANGNVYSSVNPTTGDILITWKDKSFSPTYTPQYAILNGTNNWITNPQPIPGYADIVDPDVFSSFNSTTGDFLVTMVDTGTNKPYYAILNGTNNWTTTPTAIPNSSATNNTPAFSSCNPNTSAFLTTWIDLSPTTPFYSIYTESTPPPPPPPVQAPSGLTGKQKVNNFGVVSERYNALSWVEGSGVASYLLYRNGTLIATLEGNATSYDDHNQPKATQTYTLTAQDGQGNQASSTVSVGK
ncbi:MAG: hypothetical protein NTX49_09870 [Chlamydiae bacterium]|nr:hypothetical protein [Chlamydiota bacterium]